MRAKKGIEVSTSTSRKQAFRPPILASNVFGPGLMHPLVPIPMASHAARVRLALVLVQTRPYQLGLKGLWQAAAGVTPFSPPLVPVGVFNRD